MAVVSAVLVPSAELAMQRLCSWTKLRSAAVQAQTGLPAQTLGALRSTSNIGGNDAGHVHQSSRSMRKSQYTEYAVACWGVRCLHACI